ncbi:MAG: CinA family protein [Synergistaceae bacterium]
MEKRESLETIIGKAISKKIKISFAESCTGGMVSSAFTEIPGASEIFMGSAVTYSNESKIKILGVTTQTIDTYGAVSSQCAEEMAKGSLKIYETDVAMSITGIAGPAGGTEEKPVGTVWFGYASVAKTYTFKKIFKGTRDQIRTASLNQILFTLMEEMK